jgi:hypothetical protein
MNTEKSNVENKHPALNKGAVSSSLFFLSILFVFISSCQIDEKQTEIRKNQRIHLSKKCHVYVLYENMREDTIVLSRYEIKNSRMYHNGSLSVIDRGIIARKVLMYNIISCE